MTEQEQILEVHVVQRLAALKKIVGDALAAQIRLVPQPEDVRGHILARLGCWVPTGADVETWLLENHKPPEPPKPPARDRRIEVECTESGTTSGRCHYSANYSASGTISMRESELRDLIREAGNREDAIEAFKRWALENHARFDSISIYTDNETWAGGVHPYQALTQYRQALGVPTRQIVVGMTSTNFTIADPRDNLSLDVAGFDSAVPQIIADFTTGTLSGGSE